MWKKVNGIKHHKCLRHNLSKAWFWGGEIKPSIQLLSFLDCDKAWIWNKMNPLTQYRSLYFPLSFGVFTRELLIKQKNPFTKGNIKSVFLLRWETGGKFSKQRLSAGSDRRPCRPNTRRFRKRVRQEWSPSSR